MRESNAIFPEIKYDLRKCLECDDIFTPAYRHPHQKFCKNPICCRHRDARRKSLSHQRLMRNPAYRQALSQRKSREYYHRKNLRTLRQAPEQAPEIRPSNSGERAVVISSFFKSNTLQAPEQAPEIPASGQESFERLELTMLGLIRLVTDIKASEELRELQERCYQFGKECFLPGIGRTGICTSLNSVSPHPG